LVFSLEARDPGLSAMVYDIRIYTGADLRLGKRFVDAVSEHRDGYILADLTRISQIEADALT
jgi:hypothetical protein